MTIEAILGLFVIPALAGAASGWIYWLAAGRPRPGGEESRHDPR